MPNRPKRPAPGGFRGRGSGSSFDLAEFLNGAYGGIENNPEFGQGPDGGIGPVPESAQQPYKPRAFWSRGDAARANADFKVDEYQADKGVERELGLERGKTPILNERAAFTNALAQALMRATNNSQMITQKGIRDTDENQKIYDNTLSPLAMDATGQGFMAQGEASKAASLKSVLEQALTKGSAENEIGTGIAQSLANRKLAEGNIDLAPEQILNKRIMLREQPAWLAAEAQQGGIIPVAPGQSLFNKRTGTLSYTAPSEVEQLEAYEARKKGLSTAAPTTIPQPAGQQIEGEVVKINGRYYKVRN